MTSISEYARHGFRALWMGRREVAILAWPMILITTLIAMMELLWSEANGPAGLIAEMRSLVQGYFGACFALALTRLRFYGPSGDVLSSRFRLTGSEWWLLFPSVGLLLLFLAMRASPPLVVLAMVLMMACVYPLGRLSLLVPILSIRSERPLWLAWRLGGGFFWTFVGLAFVVDLPFAIAGLFIGMVAPREGAWWTLLPVYLLRSILTAAGTAVFTVAFAKMFKSLADALELGTTERAQ